MLAHSTGDLLAQAHHQRCTKPIAVQLCWLLQRAVVQVATIFSSVCSGNLLSGFDETFETFRFALLEVWKHLACEMNAHKCEMDTSTKHQASLWCAAVVVPLCYNIRALLDTSSTTWCLFCCSSCTLLLYVRIVAVYHTLVSNTTQTSP